MSNMIIELTDQLSVCKPIHWQNKITDLLIIRQCSI